MDTTVVEAKPTNFANDGANCTAQVTVNGFIVYNPMVVPACLLAVIIGLYGGRVIRAISPKRGSYSYSITYTMYCFMMWHSMLVHCITPSIKNDLLTAIVGLIDAGLTSCIAVSFMWNSFVDNKWLDETSCKGKAIMFGSYTLIFIAWAATFYYKFTNGFLILYAGVIAVCCGLFLVAELWYLARKAKWAGISWLVLGGLFGLVGFYSFSHPAVVCAYFGQWLNASFWWDILSDLAMMALLKYFFASRIEEPSTSANNKAIADNSYEMNQVFAMPVDTNAHVVYMPMQQELNSAQVVYIPAQTPSQLN